MAESSTFSIPREPAAVANTVANPSGTARGRTALLCLAGLILFLAGGYVGYQLRFYSDLANTPRTGRTDLHGNLPAGAWSPPTGTGNLPLPNPPQAVASAPGSNSTAAAPGNAEAVAAGKAWDEAEALFVQKQWPAAKDAYTEFDSKFKTSRLHELNAATLKDRLAAIEDALNPKPQPGLIGWYYLGKDFQEGNLLIERIDATVDFAWGGGAPAPEVPIDGFCVRWVGTLKIKQPGHYTLATVTDDGARLLVDDKPLLEQWVDQADTRVAAEVDLTAGDHTITMEMYENGGGATARLFWTLTDGFAEQIIPPEALSHAPQQMKHPARRPALMVPADGDGQNGNDDHF